MRILDLTLKDLTQILRDKKSMLFLVAMPIIFTLFMGFAYKGSDQPQDNRLPLAWVDEDPAGALGEMLFARLAASETVKPEHMAQAEALAALQNGKVAGVLVIPAGFSAQSDGAQLKLIADTTSTTGQSLYQVLRVPIAQLMSAVEAAKLSAETLHNPAEFAPALELAWGKWEANSRASLVRVEKAVVQKENWFGDNPYNQASPGILVQFAIFGLVTSAQILVTERKTRTLQRMIATSMRPWQIVAGHLLAMFALVFMQEALLVVFGQLLLGVNYLAEPLGTLLVSVALGLWVASMGLLIGVLAQSDDQVILYSMLAMFVFSALGGTWFPLEGTGGAFATLGKLMPSAWAMTGYQNILMRGLGLDAAWLPTGILLAYAAGFFALAVWRFKKIEA